VQVIETVAKSAAVAESVVVAEPVVVAKSAVTESTVAEAGVPEAWPRHVDRRLVPGAKVATVGDGWTVGVARRQASVAHQRRVVIGTVA
jgi:hypothetical protein